ncbi:hypothetical protein N7457_008137 [Penicillium paradoxum]|uniref:uncharacterized protein n=1 Tax=Penicillium paradoxum TaxID=176176 RepID=UPI002547C620|nr:uncharacterized protein N7457_008137 [Penicillium paradoxum]KAJ5773241.1 hypothetical protein N7457_008137 [Penicillium paradoxum]
MTVPLNLRLASLDHDDPWIVEQRYLEIINDYLQPDSQISASDAATGVNKLTPMSRKARGEEVETPESWCLEVWSTFSEIVKQIPHDHPSQDKMVEFIKALKALPGVEVKLYQTDLWADPGPKHDASGLERCVNWHAFSARVLQSGLADWFYLTTCCINKALEEPHEVNESWECQIRAAAQWIEHSRDVIFHSLDNLADFKDLIPGPLYTGKGGLSRERWEFWEARFRALAEDGTLSEGTISMCGNAARQMAGISGVNGDKDQQDSKEISPSEA